MEIQYLSNNAKSNISEVVTNGGQIYENAIIQVMHSATVFLEIGCGYKGVLARLINNQISYKYSVGIDNSFENIRKNHYHNAVVVADAENLPFKREVFDIIINQWVIEHVRRPQIVFHQAYGVLKSDGHLISITNSIYNPLIFISHILPTRLNDRVQRLLLPKEAKEDTYPTYYRANSLRRQHALLTQIGFRMVFCQYAGFPQLFSSSRLLFKVFIYYERVTDLKYLKCMKHLLVSNYKKLPSP